MGSNLIAKLTRAGLFVAVALGLVGATGAQAASLRYEAQVSFMAAGHLAIEIERHEAGYELLGYAQTTGMVDWFAQWNGRFAGIGSMINGQPVTDAYLLMLEKGKKREFFVAANERVGIHRNDGRSKEEVLPAGADIMSMLFMTQGCYRGDRMHDGEDGYAVRLLDEDEVTLRQAKRYYSGPAVRCAYRTTDKKNEESDTIVWLAELDGALVPVKIRVRSNDGPSGVLRLRTRI